jgi:two-component system, LytTR family, response regulator
MSYRVFILEDEKHAQEMLIQYLHEVPDMNLIGSASSIDELQQNLPNPLPDLMFCDVMLPPHNSLEWLQSLQKIPFEIIFTTSFHEFAVKAFRLAAVDYLVKPVIREELMIALEKFRQRKKSDATNLQQLLNNLKAPAQARIALPSLTGFLYVPVKDIVRCESDNTYTTFYTVDKRKLVVSRTLKEVEIMLCGYPFFRVHNSHLINLDYIVEYVKGEGGLVKLSDGSQVDVSRRRKDEFLRQLK